MILEVIQDELKNQYNKKYSKIPLFIQKIFGPSFLDMQDYIPSSLEGDSGLGTDAQCALHNVNKTKNHVSIVTAEFGYGKTTWCLNNLFLWANNKKLHRQYKIVIYFSSSFIFEEIKKNGVVDQALDKQLSLGKLLNLILKNSQAVKIIYKHQLDLDHFLEEFESEILYIFDGYDEFIANLIFKSKIVAKILNAKNVWITTRKYGVEYLREHYSLSNRKVNTYTMLPLTSERMRNQYVNKLFEKKPEDKKNFQIYIKNNIKSFHELVSNPLSLQLICGAWLILSNESNPTKYKIFKPYLSLIFKRFLEKREISLLPGSPFYEHLEQGYILFEFLKKYAYFFVHSYENRPIPTRVFFGYIKDYLQEQKKNNNIYITDYLKLIRNNEAYPIKARDFNMDILDLNIISHSKIGKIEDNSCQYRFNEKELSLFFNIWYLADCLITDQPDKFCSNTRLPEYMRAFKIYMRSLQTNLASNQNLVISEQKYSEYFHQLSAFFAIHVIKHDSRFKIEKLINIFFKENGEYLFDQYVYSGIAIGALNELIDHNNQLDPTVNFLPILEFYKKIKNITYEEVTRIIQLNDLNRPSTKIIVYSLSQSLNVYRLIVKEIGFVNILNNENLSIDHKKNLIRLIISIGYYDEIIQNELFNLITHDDESLRASAVNALSFFGCIAKISKNNIADKIAGIEPSSLRSKIRNTISLLKTYQYIDPSFIRSQVEAFDQSSEYNTWSSVLLEKFVPDDLYQYHGNYCNETDEKKLDDFYLKDEQSCFSKTNESELARNDQEILDYLSASDQGREYPIIFQTPRVKVDDIRYKAFKAIYIYKNGNNYIAKRKERGEIKWDQYPINELEAIYILKAHNSTSSGATINQEFQKAGIHTCYSGLNYLECFLLQSENINTAILLVNRDFLSKIGIIFDHQLLIRLGNLVWSPDQKNVKKKELLTSIIQKWPTDTADRAYYNSFTSNGTLENIIRSSSNTTRRDLQDQELSALLLAVEFLILRNFNNFYYYSASPAKLTCPVYTWVSAAIEELSVRNDIKDIITTCFIKSINIKQPDLEILLAFLVKISEQWRESSPVKSLLAQFKGSCGDVAVIVENLINFLEYKQNCFDQDRYLQLPYKIILELISGLVNSILPTIPQCNISLSCQVWQNVLSYDTLAIKIRNSIAHNSQNINACGQRVHPSTQLIWYSFLLEKFDLFSCLQVPNAIDIVIGYILYFDENYKYLAKVISNYTLMKYYVIQPQKLEHEYYYLLLNVIRCFGLNSNITSSSLNKYNNELISNIIPQLAYGCPNSPQFWRVFELYNHYFSARIINKNLYISSRMRIIDLHHDNFHYNNSQLMCYVKNSYLYLLTSAVIDSSGFEGYLDRMFEDYFNKDKNQFRLYFKLLISSINNETIKSVFNQGLLPYFENRFTWRLNAYLSYTETKLAGINYHQFLKAIIFPPGIFNLQTNSAHKASVPYLFSFTWQLIATLVNLYRNLFKETIAKASVIKHYQQIALSKEKPCYYNQNEYNFVEYGISEQGNPLIAFPGTFDFGSQAVTQPLPHCQLDGARVSKSREPLAHDSIINFDAIIGNLLLSTAYGFIPTFAETLSLKITHQTYPANYVRLLSNSGLLLSSLYIDRDNFWIIFMPLIGAQLIANSKLVRYSNLVARCVNTALGLGITLWWRSESNLIQGLALWVSGQAGYYLGQFLANCIGKCLLGKQYQLLATASDNKEALLHEPAQPKSYGNISSIGLFAVRQLSAASSYLSDISRKFLGF
ncbi:MAG: NACHT domain-containing protein [Proteobacteria bacterium]|nr:NACHT domain-containing protein [Pseudomonadota bacterium]